MITPEQFNEIWALNPSGNFTETLNLANMICDSFPMKDGKRADYLFLYNKYKSYCSVWNKKWGARDPQFIPAKEAIKSIYDFINESMYEMEWNSPKSNKDHYFFGNISETSLREQLHKFKELIHLV